jgi:hypothetical protein
MTILRDKFSPASVVDDDDLSLAAKGLAWMIFCSQKLDREKAFLDHRSLITEIEKCSSDSDFNIEHALEDLMDGGIISFDGK